VELERKDETLSALKEKVEIMLRERKLLEEENAQLKGVLEGMLQSGQ